MLVVLLPSPSQTGILPVYHFGNTKLFDVWPKNPQHLATLQQLSRRFRVALGQHIGRWGLPVPKHVPLYMVTGKPIVVPKLSRDHPEFEATVDRVHQQVVQAVQQLYEDHMAEYGWQDRPLEIE
jgi:2-acylglycerol O-acyltransferase 2